MRTNYVLIDYENVQPEALGVLEHEQFRVFVFVGANQAKLPFELAYALQPFGKNGSYIKISGNGSNALDFHIAFYVGQLAAADPGAYFHIISKDAGFDPLIAHLKAKKILAGRCKDIAEIPMVKAMQSKNPSDQIDLVVANLRQRGAAKPRTVKTLSGTIASLFLKAISEEEVGMLLKKMETRGLLTMNGTKVLYSLPE